MSSSPEGSTRSNSLCVFLGTSHIFNSLVSVWIFSVISGDGGQRAWAACACAFSRFSNSAKRVLLRVPTPGAGFCCARHVPRPLLLPCFVAGGGVSGTTSMAGSGVFACARGGVIGGVISYVTGRYCRAACFAGCDVGGTEEARGCGNSSVGLGRSLGILGSARSVECRRGSSVMRCTVGGSSLM